MGKQTKTVKIYSNDPENSEMVLTITGNVVSSSQVSGHAPTIYFNETQHDFGKVNEGDNVRKDAQVFTIAQLFKMKAKILVIHYDILILKSLK